VALVEEITVRHHTLLDNRRIVGVVDVDVTVNGINGGCLCGRQRLVRHTRLGLNFRVIVVLLPVKFTVNARPKAEIAAYLLLELYCQNVRP
jgi:hypothetical protein